MGKVIKKEVFKVKSMDFIFSEAAGTLPVPSQMRFSQVLTAVAFQQEAGI